MQSKNAITHLLNRYKAVLKKCHILNNFGMLLKHSAVTATFMAVLAGSTCMPSAAQAFQLICNTGTSINCYTVADPADYFLLEPEQSGKSYVSTSSLPGSGTHGLLYKNPADQSPYDNINDLLGAIIPQSVPGRYVIGQGATGSITFTTNVDNIPTQYYVTPLQTPSLGRIDNTLNADITSGAFYDIANGAIGNVDSNGGHNISADFFGNTSLAEGGALRNATDTVGTTISIGDITGSFIANTAKGNGGAFLNNAYASGATASMGNITGSFIANTAERDNGGGFFNYSHFAGAKATIGAINAHFIANAANHSGGAFVNWASDGSMSSMGDINAAFIANTAVDNGGAFLNWASDGSMSSIGDITATFIANTADSGGGAFYNGASIDSTSSIGDITATFIGNTAARGNGGAFYNDSSNDNSAVSIGNITGSFIANTAAGSGGAFASVSSATSTASIGDITASFISNTAGVNGGAMQIFRYGSAKSTVGHIDADFIDNIADTNKTDAESGLGGAIYTSESLNFLAKSKTNVFSGNRDSSGYNAIHIVAGSDAIPLNFVMQNTGSFMLNDSITTSTAGGYDMNISGQDTRSNIFYLNNAINDAHTINVQAATLRLGTVTHAGQNFVGGIHASNTNINNGGVLDVAVNNGNTASINSNLRINDGGTLKSTSGNINVAQANFASQSVFIYDADAMGNAAALLSTGGTLNVAEGAKLQVLSSTPTAQTQPITLVSGFTNPNSTIQGWDPIITQDALSSSLQSLRLNPFNYTTGTLTAQILSNTGAGIARDYPEMQDKTTQFLSHVSADNHSHNAGVRLMSRATDELFVGRTRSRDATKIIEGALQMGNIAGVAKSGFSAGLASSGSVVARLSPSGFGTGSEQAPAIAMLDDTSTEQTMAGVAAGSHMMGSSSGIQDGVSLWLMPLYKHSAVHGLEAGAFDHGSSSDLGGLSLGADYTFNEMFRLGLALNIGTGFSHSTGDFDETTNNFDFWGVSLYGGLYKNDFALMADVGLSKVFGDVNQDLDPSMQMSNLNASTQSTVWTAGLTAEYTFKTSFVDIIPHASVRYMNVHTYGYDIKSGGTVAEIAADNQEVWYFPVGVTFAKDIVTASGWSFTPKVDVGFIAAAGNLDVTAKASISQVAGSVEYTMQNVDGFAFNGGLGLEVAKDDFSMGLNYNLQASEHETGHILSLTCKYSF